MLVHPRVRVIELGRQWQTRRPASHDARRSTLDARPCDVQSDIKAGPTRLGCYETK